MISSRLTIVLELQPAPDLYIYASQPISLTFGQFTVYKNNLVGLAQNVYKRGLHHIMASLKGKR